MRESLKKRITHAAALFLATLHAGCALAAIDSPLRIDAGLVAGTGADRPDLRVFRGIPFAAPPVGELRWRAPQPVSAWKGIRQADHFGPACMQAASGGPVVAMSEDCLYLNVWTTAVSASERRPVMVWIHPGGYVGGSASTPRYDGAALAAHGVVVVTLNYRLGPFGFFSHPELTRESHGRWAANQGLLDQVAALQWVSRNIAAFGGNPQCVTVFGNSAGAGSVANLMAAPLAQGLFHRAIAQSASWPGLSIEPMPRLAQAEHAGMQAARSLNAGSLQQLRALRAEELLALKPFTRPVIDGWFLPESPGRIYAAGRQSKVPLLVGSNQDEGTFFLKPTSRAQWIGHARQRFGKDADAYLNVYPGGSDAEATRSQYTAFRDELHWLMRKWAQLQATTASAPVFLYFFNHVPAAAPAWPAPMSGATHGAEEQYIFGNPRGAHEWSASDRKMSQTLAAYWVNFATRGDPNGAGLPSWRPFDPLHRDRALLLDTGSGSGAAPNEDQLAFYESWYERELQ